MALYKCIIITIIIIIIISGGLPIRQLPKARHGAEARNFSVKKYRYLPVAVMNIALLKIDDPLFADSLVKLH